MSGGDNTGTDSYDTANVPVAENVIVCGHGNGHVNCADDSGGGSHDNENMSGGDNAANMHGQQLPHR